MNKIEFGDCRETMRRWAADGVKAQMCVTSPPYFGLRDYGHEGQIGLEQTPEEYIAAMVEVFRCVRDVLADDGTLWLNIGDSYANDGKWGGSSGGKHAKALHGNTSVGRTKVQTGLKPKDLIGIPWAVATALRDPYYAGRIRDISDRVWLAAMIDGEGCMFIHKRKAGTDSGARFTRADGTEAAYMRNADTYGAGLEVANTHLAIIENCIRITGVGSVVRQEKDRRQPLYRWNVRSNECRWIIQEVYPHLVAKKHQARLLLGCPSSGERADAAHQALMGLHGGTPTDVDFKPPESLFRPGYYLRQDLIWAKSNPMPESVRDRCTKAHEYLFLLSKSERYLFDSEAMREDAVGKNHHDLTGPGYKAPGQAPNTGNRKALRTDIESRHRSQIQGGQSLMAEPDGKRNRRSVWTVATRPYKGAHFATFPPALIEPCILAGSRPGDIVLDPFMGSGTTAQVALQHGRQYLGCELNPDYGPLQDERINGRPKAVKYRPAKVAQAEPAVCILTADLFHAAPDPV